jgi:hypothetical protein
MDSRPFSVIGQLWIVVEMLKDVAFFDQTRKPVVKWHIELGVESLEGETVTIRG